MGKIASAEDADTQQQAAKRWRQRFEPDQKRPRKLRRAGTFTNEQPESRDGHQPWQESPKKNFAERMAGGFEEPERRERAGDGADRVHKAFETEGAAVGAGGDVSSEQGFLCGRADATAQPSG